MFILFHMYVHTCRRTHGGMCHSAANTLSHTPTRAGHGKAVKDTCFNNDGTKFLSCSYDKYVKLWDTETGKCEGRFTNKKMAYCIRFNPDEASCDWLKQLW